MEYLNRIELTGVVGQCTIENIGGVMHARFSVATNYCYKDAEGSPVVETTWHQVSAWESKTLSLEHLDKGCRVNLSGRLRMIAFTDADGFRHSLYEVMAQTLNILL